MCIQQRSHHIEQLSCSQGITYNLIGSLKMSDDTVCRSARQIIKQYQLALYSGPRLYRHHGNATIYHIADITLGHETP